MSRSLLHDWEHAIDRCCRDDNPKEMISIAEDIYNTAYVRGQNHSIELEEVLGKIRAEIKHFMYNVNPSSSESDYACNYILDILDKVQGK